MGQLDHRGTLNHLTFLCLFTSQSPAIPSIWPPGGVWTNQKLKGTFDHLIKFSAIFKNYQQDSEFDGFILISSNPYLNVVLNNNFRFTETLSISHLFWQEKKWQPFYLEEFWWGTLNHEKWGTLNHSSIYTVGHLEHRATLSHLIFQ